MFRVVLNCYLFGIYKCLFWKCFVNVYLYIVDVKLNYCFYLNILSFEYF